jgi:regulator of sirC expression with transglutaminase-like and TPR domain
MQLEDEHLKANTYTQIINRILQNLVGVAIQEREGQRMLTYLNAIITIEPESGSDRWLRARLHNSLKHYQSAFEDTRWLLEHHPEEINLREVRSFYEYLLARQADKE